jgi:isopenicillin-N N-acyltransferase like protein
LTPTRLKQVTKIRSGRVEVEMAEANREVPVLVLEGTPRQRGQIYGETRKEGIRSHIEKWKMYLEISNQMDPETYIAQFLEETNFLNAVKKWTPALLDEIEGIGEGAGVDFKTIFALQLPDEEWWYHREKNGLDFSGIGSNLEHCSTIGIYGQDGIPSYLAQNLDVPGYYDGYQLLLHIKEPKTGHASLVFSVDGMIALAGLNNRGIGICCNALLPLNHSKDGLPVACVHRGVLSYSSIIDSVNFVFRIKHASGQNYMVGYQNYVIGLECSANKIIQQLPARGTSLICHTNHPLINDDLVMGSAGQNSLKFQGPDRAILDSEIRLNTLISKLNRSPRPIGMEQIKSVLSSHDSPEHPICRHKTSETGAMTLGTLIMELSPSPTLTLLSGPPCSSAASTYRF